MTRAITHVMGIYRPGASRLLTDKDLSRLVRQVRGMLGISQEKLAVRLGVAFASVNRWENGRAKPSPLALRQIGELLVELGDRGKPLHQEYFTDMA